MISHDFDDFDDDDDDDDDDEKIILITLINGYKPNPYSFLHSSQYINLNPYYQLSTMNKQRCEPGDNSYCMAGHCSWITGWWFEPL